MSTTHTADPGAPTGLLKSIGDEEPVLAGAVALWLVGSVGDLLATNGVVTSTQWSGVAPVATSMLAGILLTALGWLVRHVVTSPKGRRALLTELDKANAAAATAGTPIVVQAQIDGKDVPATVVTPANTAPATETTPEEATPLDGLPPVTPAQPDPFMQGGSTTTDPAALGAGTTNQIGA